MNETEQQVYHMVQNSPTNKSDIVKHLGVNREYATEILKNLKEEGRIEFIEGTYDYRAIKPD